MRAGLANADFEAQIRERMNDILQDEPAREYLFQLSKPRR
jgi:hypothetical protein